MADRVSREIGLRKSRGGKPQGVKAGPTRRWSTKAWGKDERG